MSLQGRDDLASMVPELRHWVFWYSATELKISDSYSPSIIDRCFCFFSVCFPYACRIGAKRCFKIIIDFELPRSKYNTKDVCVSIINRNTDRLLSLQRFTEHINGGYNVMSTSTLARLSNLYQQCVDSNVNQDNYFRSKCGCRSKMTCQFLSCQINLEDKNFVFFEIL